MNNLKSASNLDLHDENEEQENSQQKNKKSEYDLSHLSAAEVQQIKRGERTIEDLAAERDEYKKEAEVKLKELVTARTDRPNVIDLTEYKSILKELEETKSPDKTQEIIDRLEKLPNERANQRANEEKKREPDDPALKEHTDKIFDELDDPKTVTWIGSKQQAPFKQWFKQEIAKNPTIKHAKELLHELHEHRNGLKPRHEFFDNILSPTLKKYDLTLDKAPYFEAEGLSEREQAMEKILEAEKKIEGLRQAGLYSLKAKKETVTTMLKADSVGKINQIHEDVLEVTRKEAEQYTDQNNSLLSNTTVNVNGITVQAMSKKSMELFLTDYQEYDLETRKDTIINWKKIAENEGKLVKDLGDVYKDDPEGFKVAVKAFALLTYQEKTKALKDHKELLKENDRETVRESNLILTEALGEIDTARSDKVLSNKTAKEFRAWAMDNKNYKDEKTQKLDVKKQRKLVDSMKDKTPVFESKKRNIAAYRWVKDNKFKPELASLKKDNPDVSPQDIDNWQTKYDEGSFSERKQVYLDLKAETAKLAKEREEDKKREEDLGINKEDKENVPSLERFRVVKVSRQAIMSEDPEDVKSALKAIYLYLANDEDADINKDSELKELRDGLEAIRKLKALKTKITDDTFEEEVETEMENVMTTNMEIADEVEEANVKHLNVELAKQSENQHDREKDARKRALDESLDRTEADSIEEDLTIDAYKQMGESHVLDEEGTGEEVLDVEFTERGMDHQDLQKLKERTRKQQANIDYQIGAENIMLVDNSGRTLNAEEASAFEEEANEELTEQLAEEAQQQMEDRNAGAKVFDLQSRVAAKRKAEDLAKQMIENKESEKLRKAA